MWTLAIISGVSLNIFKCVIRIVNPTYTFLGVPGAVTSRIFFCRESFMVVVGFNVLGATVTNFGVLAIKKFLKALRCSELFIN